MALTTFKEMQRRVQQRILNDSTATSDTINDFIPKCKVWINERYERIVRSKPWEYLNKETELQIVASQEDYAMPRSYDAAGFVSAFDATNGIRITYTSAAENNRFSAVSHDVTDSTLTGNPLRFYNIGQHTTKTQTGSAAEKVGVTSTSSSDVSPLVVHIKGLSSSVEIEEDVILTGVTEAQTTNTYDADQKLEISLGTNDGTTPVPVGTITADGVTSSNVLTKISKFTLATTYQWIRVSPTPKSTGTQPLWKFWHRRKFEPLTDDNDIPIFDCVNAIIVGTYADALREDGQETVADTSEMRFVALVEELWDNTHNPDQIQQFIPQQSTGLYVDEYNRTII